jgi:hypothetical protein
MTNFLGKSLADGQLAATKTTLLTVAAGKVVYVRWASWHSTSAVTQAVVISVTRSGGTSRIIDRGELDQNWTGFSFQESSLELSEGDILEGQSTTASVVDYVISGAEEDA